MRPPPCPHHDRLDDCGTCVAALHREAVSHARTVSMAAPEGSQALAEHVLDRAIAAQIGCRVLRENGIPIATSARLCHVCSCPASGGVCPSVRCPGRRVRYQPPAVRS